MHETTRQAVGDSEEAGARPALDTPGAGAAPPVDSNKLPSFFSLKFSTRAISLAVGVIVVTQLTFYSTDVLGLSGALIGTLFLVARVLDAFTDLVIGMIIDRTKSRWGKARPYELMIIPFWIAVIAVFSTPDMGTFGTAAFVMVCYFLIHSVCQTALQASEAVYLRRAARNEVQYAKVLSRQGVFVILVAGVASVMLPQLISSWGSEPGGWTRIALVYGIPMMALGLVRFFTIKELPLDVAAETETNPKIREIIRTLTKNKYAFILGALVLVANIVVHMSTITGTYFFRYIYGDVGLLSFVSLGAIILPFVFLLFPLAVRKIGGMNFVRTGLVLAIGGYMLVFFLPSSLPAVILGQLLGALASILTILIGFFAIQAMVYGEWKTGVRVEAAVNAVANFAGKLGQGIAPAMVGFLIAAVGYDGLADTQNQQAETMIVALYSVIPAAFCLLLLALTYFWKLDKHMDDLNHDLKHGFTSKNRSETLKI